MMDGSIYSFPPFCSSSSASVGATQDPSSNDQQRSRRPAHIYGSPELSPPPHDQWVEETCDDAVSRQADRDDTQEPCYYKHNASSQANISFGQPIVTVEVGAARSNHGEPDGHHADGDGDTDQSPGSLQFLW